MKNLEITFEPKQLNTATKAQFRRELFKARCRKLFASQLLVETKSPAITRFIQEYPDACLLERIDSAEMRVHLSGAQLSRCFTNNCHRQFSYQMLRKNAAETVLELMEVAFTFSANLRIPLVSIGNPWKKPQRGEITVTPCAKNHENERFAFALLSLDSGKNVSGLTFELSEHDSSIIDPIPCVSPASIKPEFSRPRLVFSNVR